MGATKDTDDFLANVCKRDAMVHKYLCADAFTFTDEPEKDVFGAHVVVAELQRLAKPEFEQLLGSGSERDVARRDLRATTDDPLYVVADRIEGDLEILQRHRGDAFTLVDQAQQDVLGPDVVVVEESRLFLREDNNPSCSVSEALEDWNQSLLFCGSEYT